MVNLVGMVTMRLSTWMDEEGELGNIGLKKEDAYGRERWREGVKAMVMK